MHELSIAQAVVSTVAEHAAGRRVLTVTMRVGVLASLVPEAMRFCWDVATSGTCLAGSALVIERVPVAAACLTCGRTEVTAGPSPLRCPACDGPAFPREPARQLEIAGYEVDDDLEGVAP